MTYSIDHTLKMYIGRWDLNCQYSLTINTLHCMTKQTKPLKKYIGEPQKHPYPLYPRLVGDSPTVGLMSEGNMKNICKAVEAVHRAAPG